MQFFNISPLFWIHDAGKMQFLFISLLFLIKHNLET